MLDGEEIVSALNGLFHMPSGEQLMDCRTRVSHTQPFPAYKLYKGHSRRSRQSVFSRKIFCPSKTPKTDAPSKTTSALPTECGREPKPQLEIYADDVKCTHGATVGELDEQALYYLRSRGIPLTLIARL